MLASREASSQQQQAAGNRQQATAISVAPVAVAVRAALTADTVVTEDLTAHWVTLVRIWAVSRQCQHQQHSNGGWQWQW